MCRINLRPVEDLDSVTLARLHNGIGIVLYGVSCLSCGIFSGFKVVSFLIYLFICFFYIFSFKILQIGQDTETEHINVDDVLPFDVQMFIFSVLSNL